MFLTTYRHRVPGTWETLCCTVPTAREESSPWSILVTFPRPNHGYTRAVSRWTSSVFVSSTASLCDREACLADVQPVDRRKVHMYSATTPIGLSEPAALAGC
jgi:hypothetical protein